jgi:hypothetical protein
MIEIVAHSCIAMEPRAKPNKRFDSIENASIDSLKNNRVVDEGHADNRAWSARGQGASAGNFKLTNSLIDLLQELLRKL